jgi:hypothetical protein
MKPRMTEPLVSRPPAQKPQAAPAVASTETATAVMTKPAAKPTHAEVAERAKTIWIAGGRKPGCDEQNWLAAERQLRKERGLI